MRKIMLSLLLSCTMLPALAQSSRPMTGFKLSFSVRIIDPDAVGRQAPLTPAAPPVVTQDEHTLFIYTEHSGYTLELLDDSEDVAYTTYIPAGTYEVELPGTLTGTHTIQLITETFKYIGVIEL